jgi:hypothetical protein
MSSLDNSGGSNSRLISRVVLVIAVIVASATWAVASGARTLRRSDPQVARSAPSITNSNRRGDSTDEHSQRGQRRIQRRGAAQVIVIPSPTYYYSPYYFAARPALVNAPFFCLEHGVGFVSRVGLIDHLGGTHKFALQHAAAICPDDVDTCIFDGVWPLY